MIIRGPRIIRLDTGNISGPVDIIIDGGTITRTEPRADKAGDKGTETAGQEVVHAEGLYAIPGLVNTHAHTAMTLLRGSAEDVGPEAWFNEHIWMYEKNLTPHDVYIGTLLGAAEMLLGGVTWVADHYFHMNEAFRAFEESGMRATLCEAVFGTGEGDDEALKRSEDFIGEYGSRNSRIEVCLGPHSPYLCSDEFLSKTTGLAEKLNVPMHIHVSEVAGQLEHSLQTRGITPVEVLENTGVLRPGTILAHAYYATDEDLARIQAHRCGVAHCPKTYMKFGDAHDFMPRALSAGVRVGLGTDGAASNNTLDIFEAARTAALLAKTAGGDPAAAKITDVLPMLCAGGRVLGNPRYGKIEPGAPADIVLLSSSGPNMLPSANLPAHLLYSVTPKDVDTVIVAGKTVVRNGKLVTLDLAALAEEAEDIYRRLITIDGGEPMQRYTT